MDLANYHQLGQLSSTLPTFINLANYHGGFHYQADGAENILFKNQHFSQNQHLLPKISTHGPTKLIIINLAEYHQLGQISSTWSNIINLVKYPQPGQISSTWSSIINLVKCHQLGQVSSTWSSIINLV